MTLDDLYSRPAIVDKNMNVEKGTDNTMAPEMLDAMDPGDCCTVTKPEKSWSSDQEDK